MPSVHYRGNRVFLRLVCIEGGTDMLAALVEVSATAVEGGVNIEHSPPLTLFQTRRLSVYASHIFFRTRVTPTS